MPQEGPIRRAGRLKVAGLFAGIGGIELGLRQAEHESVLLCELDPAAQAVLRTRFPDVALHDDIATLEALPPTDVVTAGFPCQDLSQAGRTAGIRGAQSSLVGHVFRLLDQAEEEPTWLLLENVPFMLQLDRGQAMSYLVSELDRRGWRWAYRVVDSRAFGLPQRRLRVILLASREADPRPALFGDEAELVDAELSRDSWCGFYWTEGLRGLGWAVDAVPTLKGGSAVGIPSPPAVWKRPTGEIGTPQIGDAERLQGFPDGFTRPAVEDPTRRNGPRWKLVGNAVSVPVARWIGERMDTQDRWKAVGGILTKTGTWPKAAWGSDGEVYAVACTSWPRSGPTAGLGEFLEYGLEPLTFRATAGFLSRARRSSLRFHPEFIADLESHLERERLDLHEAA